jgi:primosomal protein N'
MAELLSLKKPVQIIGPTPAFYEKVAGKYEWQLVVKAKDRKQLLELIPHLPNNVIYDLDPSNLL